MSFLEQASTAAVPFSKEAEQSVVGALLARPKVTGEVIGTLLLPEHFHSRALRILFDRLVDAHYKDGSVDPLTIVELGGADLLGAWDCDKETAVTYVRRLAGAGEPHNAVAHAKLVKRDHDRRALLELAADITARASEPGADPERIAAEVSQRSMQVATNTVLSNEIISYGDLGRRFARRQEELRRLRKEGIELGAFFGLNFIDERVHGLKPGELFILAGEPGCGKSGVSFCAARAFAERQMKKPEDKRLGAFILSLEMGEEPTSDRFGQSEGFVDGGKLRDGTATDDEMAKIIQQWGRRQDIPLHFNFTSLLRTSQVRAMIVEAIRRHGVNLVVIDHMRYMDSDTKHDSKADEDEEKARFLKESIAKDLGVAVIVLAHTTKAVDTTDDRRPRLSHLRGGGMVAAHADYVAFQYRPAMHATEDEILDGSVRVTDSELIYEKNRHGLTGATPFHFDPSVMNTRDLI